MRIQFNLTLYLTLAVFVFLRLIVARLVPFIVGRYMLGLNWPLSWVRILMNKRTAALQQWIASPI